MPVSIATTLRRSPGYSAKVIPLRRPRKVSLMAKVLLAAGALLACAAFAQAAQIGEPRPVVEAPAVVGVVHAQLEAPAHESQIALAYALPVASSVVAQAAPAPAPASLPAVDAGATAGLLLQAFHDHSYTLAVAAALMLLIWCASKFGLLGFLPAKYVPLLSVAISGIGAACTAILSHQALGSALSAGIESGLAAVGAWEAAGQHLLTFGKAAAPPAA
jgi:hypothetical protein